LRFILSKNFYATLVIPHGIFDHSTIMYNSSVVGYHGDNGTGRFAYYSDLVKNAYDIRYMELTYYHIP